MIHYYTNEHSQLNAHIMFVCDIKSRKNVKKIYDEHIDNNFYSFSHVLDIFSKYDTIVIVDNGRRIMRYHPEYVQTYIKLYHDRNLDCEYISELIKQIGDDKSIHYVPNGMLHTYLQSHLDVLKMCVYAIFLLRNCYTDIKILILMRFITLCQKSENIKDIVNMIRQKGKYQYDSSYWSGFYFLEK